MKRIIGKHKAFLKSFAVTGSITKAAKAAKIDRRDHYRWLKEKPGYAEEFAEASRQAAELLEDEAVRRAYDGTFEPNIYQGQFIFPEKKKRNPKTGKLEKVVARKPLGVLKYSDSLLQFLLKGRMPERYRDRVSAEVTGKDGGPIAMDDTRLTTLTDDELTQLLALARKLTPAGGDSGGGGPAPAK